MGVAISTLTAVTRATLISGAVISSSEHNTWSTAVKTQLNDIGTTAGVLADLEDNYASASQPGDKPAGKVWYDSANTQPKIYLTAGGTPAPIPVGLAGSNPYILPDVAARTINVSGVDQNSYVSATGTAGTDATAQIVKQITLKANSLNAVGRGIQIRVLYKATSTTSIVVTLYIGTAGTGNDSNIALSTSTATTVYGWIDAKLLYSTSGSLAAIGGLRYNPGADTVVPVLNGFLSTNIATGSDMFISVGQSNTAATHIVVYAIYVEQLG